MEGIKDRVAIVGMGCSNFGERWDASFNDLLVESAYEAYEDAGVGPEDIQAAWVSFTGSSRTGEGLARPLKLNSVPITHVENACASGGEAIRNAAFAVAAGEYDLVLAIGAEKLKDSGLRGLTAPGDTGYWQPVIDYGLSAPGDYALAATRYFFHYGLSLEEGKRILAKIAVKNHHNGFLCPKSHLQFEVTEEQVINAPMIAQPLGLLDCCGISDGSAAAIITRADLAKKFRRDYVLIKGIGSAISHGLSRVDNDFDYITFEETRAATKMAYKGAGITNPRKELDIVQLHDAFTIGELIQYEMMGLCGRGEARREVEAGSFTLEGDLPICTDGGLKAFGHPTGASGLRQAYETYKQLQGKAQLPQRQIKNAKLGMCFNQGGLPGQYQAICIILGLP